MAYRLVIDGNTVYEIDEECESKQGGVRNQPSRQWRAKKQVHSVEGGNQTEKRPV